jgi:hypothetical protein
MQLVTLKNMGEHDEWQKLYDRYWDELHYFKEKYQHVEIQENTCHSDSLILSTCMQEEIEKIENDIGKLSEAGLSYLKYFVAPICRRPALMHHCRE